jgi:hypothetical protein
MEHDEFLQAVCALATAYAILSRAVARALPPQLAAVAAVDPLTRITLEQFGDPLVRLLIQAAVGSSGGAGGWRTNRSGWAA